MTSIFPANPWHWSDYLDVLTPVELRDGLWYKREDYFAPLGYGGPNGAKLRQLIYLVERYVQEGGNGGILTGASVLSPQNSMAALVAREYDLPCTVVLGATNADSAIKHENVAIAARAGAEFIFAPVAYNPALQRTVQEVHATERFRGWYRLCYGITTPETASDAEVEAFHRVGARQAENVPEEVRTIVMTAGSCNSCVSVLYGLACAPPPRLERVVLLGIGPTRLQWIEDRLAAISAVYDFGEGGLGGIYRRQYHNHRDLEAEHQTDGRWTIEHYDLHSTGFCSYSDRMPFTCDGIDFHPTYEGKAMTWLHQRTGGITRDGTILFWIVGSAPSLAAMTENRLLASHA